MTAPLPSILWWLLRQPSLYPKVLEELSTRLRRRSPQRPSPRLAEPTLRVTIPERVLKSGLLEGPRLLLRRFEREDIVQLRSLTLSDVLQAYRRSTALWAVVERPSGSVVGYCSLTAMDVGETRALELGYSIAPRYRGLGYATEAASLARDEAFRNLGAQRLVAIAEPDNAASLRVLEKLGFTSMGDGVFFKTAVRVFETTEPGPGSTS